jgi:hypothetical protein
MLEDLVRPFTASQPLGTRRVISTSIKLPSQNAHLQWGNTGALPTPVETPAEQPAVGINFKVKKEDQTLKEKGREIEKVKVQQEGNPDNFVVIERIKSITFGNTKKEQTVLTPSTAQTKTTGVTKPPVDGGGDIPVTVQGDVLFVDKRNLPDWPGYFEIGDRIFTLTPPPPGPQEVPL